MKRKRLLNFGICQEGAEREYRTVAVVHLFRKKNSQRAFAVTLLRSHEVSSKCSATISVAVPVLVLLDQGECLL